MMRDSVLVKICERDDEPGALVARVAGVSGTMIALPASTRIWTAAGVTD